MVSTHTPGPWFISSPGSTDQLYVGPLVVASHRTALGGGASSPDLLSHIDDETLHENARRIVACVNACIGLDTSLLENCVLVGDTLLNRFQVLNQEAARLIKQRDELLAALNEIKQAALGQGAFTGARFSDIARMADTAIAKARVE